jgi:hypothetical protein
MLRVWTPHKQTSTFDIDRDRLHGLRRDERCAIQIGIRDTRIAGDRRQGRILRRRDAKPPTAPSVAFSSPPILMAMRLTFIRLGLDLRGA